LGSTARASVSDSPGAAPPAMAAALAAMIRMPPGPAAMVASGGLAALSLCRPAGSEYRG
jgi:hypothetical protein